MCGRFPRSMVNRVAQCITATLRERHAAHPIGEDIEDLLVEQDWFHRKPAEPENEHQPGEAALALSRQKLPEQPPTGEQLELVRQMMMRVHRASGHASMASLAKLLARRGAPTWAQEMARSLQCPDCLESRRPTASPPSSLKEPPALWEMVGSDVFEFGYSTPEGTAMKINGCIWHDRASGTASVSMMQ